MKKLFLVLFMLTFCSFAQFRDAEGIKPSLNDEMIDKSPNFILGFFDASKFSMKHSYSLSYNSFGSNSMALGVYTNSMMYQFRDNLNLQVDASVVHSPYNSFGKNFQNDINGVYLSRAELNYSPAKDMNISIMYRNIPSSQYLYGDRLGRNPYYNDFLMP